MTDVSANASSPFAKSVVSPRLVGRGAELAHLEELLVQRLRSPDNGHYSVALVSGEAGLGKSRLIAALEEQARTRQTVVLRGHCYETDRMLPYAPLRDLLRRYLQDDAHKLDRLEPALAPLLPDAWDGTPMPTAGNLPPDIQKYRLFEAFARFCLQCTAQFAPEHAALLLVIEDLHWADDSTLEQLLHLVRRFERSPSLLLFTMRPDEVTPALARFCTELDRQRACSDIRLRPLARSQVDAMLRAVFDQERPIRTDFLDAVYSLSEGNPFYVEEIVKSLLIAGDIFYVAGSWDRKPLAELHIPRSIQEVVRRRREQLSPPAQSLLEAASVAGRRFDFTLMRDVLERSDDDLLSQLKELLAAQFVVEESDDRFAFRHALAREAIYKSLLGRERVALHRRIGNYLAAHNRAPSALTSAGELAYHFYEGQVWQLAFDFATAAGSDALALYAPRAAVEQYSRALTAAEHLQIPSGPIRLLRGRAHAMRSEFEAALTDFEAAQAEARLAQCLTDEWDALIALGMLWGTRNYGRAGELLQQALYAARSLDDPARVGRSLNQLGNWLMNTEQPFAALRLHEEALAIFRRLDNRAGMAETLDLLAIVHYNCGDLLAGHQCYEEAIPLWRALGDRQGLVHSLGGWSLRADFTLEYDSTPVDECIPYAEESMRLARSIEWRSGESLALICAGLVFVQAGRYNEALEYYTEALAIAREIEHPGWLADSLRAIGALLCDLGLYGAARAALEESLTIARSHHSLIWIRQTGSTLAVMHARLGNLTAAHAVLTATSDVDLLPPAAAQTHVVPSSYSPRQATLQERLLAAAHAELLLADGKAEGALAKIDSLIDATVNLSTDHVVPHLWWLRGRARAAVGRYQEALLDLQAALQTARDQGRLPLAAHISASLAHVCCAAGETEQAHAIAADFLAAAANLAGRLPETPAPLPTSGSASLRTVALAEMMSWLPDSLRPVPESPAAPAAKTKTAQAEISLSRRELEVAELVTQGQTNRAIAERLVISERTAERHVANIMAKLGMSTRAQIAAWGAQRSSTRG